jgi:hypothetical protein
MGLARSAEPLLDHIANEFDDRVLAAIAGAVMEQPAEAKESKRATQLREWAAEALDQVALSDAFMNAEREPQPFEFDYEAVSEPLRFDRGPEQPFDFHEREGAPDAGLEETPPREPLPVRVPGASARSTNDDEDETSEARAPESGAPEADTAEPRASDDVATTPTDEDADAARVRIQAAAPRYISWRAPGDGPGPSNGHETASASPPREPAVAARFEPGPARFEPSAPEPAVEAAAERENGVGTEAEGEPVEAVVVDEPEPAETLEAVDHRFEPAAAPQPAHEFRFEPAADPEPAPAGLKQPEPGRTSNGNGARTLAERLKARSQ